MPNCAASSGLTSTCPSGISACRDGELRGHGTGMIMREVTTGGELDRKFFVNQLCWRPGTKGVEQAFFPRKAILVQYGGPGMVRLLGKARYAASLFQGVRSSGLHSSERPLLFHRRSHWATRNSAGRPKRVERSAMICQSAAHRLRAPRLYGLADVTLRCTENVPILFGKRYAG